MTIRTRRDRLHASCPTSSFSVLILLHFLPRYVFFKCERKNRSLIKNVVHGNPFFELLSLLKNVKEMNNPFSTRKLMVQT